MTAWMILRQTNLLFRLLLLFLFLLCGIFRCLILLGLSLLFLFLLSFLLLDFDLLFLFLLFLLLSVLLFSLFLLFLLFLFLLSIVGLRHGNIGIGVVRLGCCHQLAIPFALVVALCSSWSLHSRRTGLCLALELPEPGLHVGPALNPNGGTLRLTERIHPAGQRALSSQHAGHLALELGRSLANQRGMVDEPVLGGLTLGLQCTEQCLLSAQDLHGGGGVLGEGHEAAGMGDESRSDQLPD
mmetsp:Transcript_8493/g.11463  ORF Transcript_8493/g.11463 Transcript_8493/m.11463 type:complete len:241 (-) Transcript_8493:1020-1742(-)